MTFEELGATFKAEREKRNLSIDDVAAKLKITPRQLRALENGDLAGLPPVAYAKGFIRAYAAFLGIGQDEIQNTLDMLGSLQGKPIPKVDNAGRSNSAPKTSKGGKWFVALLILAILGAGGYYLWQNGFFTSLINKTKSSRDIAREIPTADAWIAQKEAAKSASDSTGAEHKDPDPAPTLPEGVQEKPEEPAPVQATLPEPAPESPAVRPDEPHSLVITAVEECWVHSNADKTDTRQFSLRKGDTFALTFSNSLELKLGNAGGVRLRYDGEELPPPGTSGQVKTITFPPAPNL